jgi:hypothetical protein
MEAMHEVGFKEEMKTPETWRIAFDRMRAAKVIP